MGTTKDAKETKGNTRKGISHRWTQINTDDFRALSFVSFASFVVLSSSPRLPRWVENLRGKQRFSLIAVQRIPKPVLSVLRSPRIFSRRTDFFVLLRRVCGVRTYERIGQKNGGQKNGTVQLSHRWTQVDTDKASTAGNHLCLSVSICGSQFVQVRCWPGRLIFLSPIFLSLFLWLRSQFSFFCPTFFCHSWTSWRGTPKEKQSHAKAQRRKESRPAPVRILCVFAPLRDSLFLNPARVASWRTR